MRVVCLSDTHGNCDLEVPEGDLLLHTGDLSRSGTRQELERAAEWLKALPHPHKVIIAGNHDFCLQSSTIQECRQLFAPMNYLQDEGLVLDGLTIWGAPWTPTFGGVWAFQGTMLSDCWQKIPQKTNILLTHGPPRHRLDRTYSGSDAGCPELARRVSEVRPALHVFGHIHEGYGISEQEGSLFVNASNSAVGYLYSQPAHVLEWDGSVFRPVTAWTAADPLWSYLVRRWGAPHDLSQAGPDQRGRQQAMGQLFWLHQHGGYLGFSTTEPPGGATPLSFGIKLPPRFLALLNTNRWSHLP